jgi:predicted DNA-binding ArsR family transcriptional regulator
MMGSMSGMMDMLNDPAKTISLYQVSVKDGKRKIFGEIDRCHLTHLDIVEFYLACIGTCFIVVTLA